MDSLRCFSLLLLLRDLRRPLKRDAVIIKGFQETEAFSNRQILEEGTEILHLKSGNLFLDFLDVDDLHDEGVMVSVM